MISMKCHKAYNKQLLGVVSEIPTVNVGFGYTCS